MHSRTSNSSRYFTTYVSRPGRKWTLITSSATKNSGNSTIGGVSLLLSPLAIESLNSVEKISSRIVIASFNGNPALTVIACYSPTNVSDEQHIIDFYDDLPPCVKSVPKHNILIIGSDLNAHLMEETKYNIPTTILQIEMASIFTHSYSKTNLSVSTHVSKRRLVKSGPTRIQTDSNLK